jgi:hypothetical protein
MAQRDECQMPAWKTLAGKLSKTLDNMLTDNRNAFQRWRDSPTQPTAAADVAGYALFLYL